MFESVEVGRSVSKSDYKKRSEQLRAELLELQAQHLTHAHRQLILLFAGVDGGGKGETIARLNEWMDPRWLRTSAYEPLNEVERRMPSFWRYWRDLPPRGRIGMFMSAWYSTPLLDHVYDRLDKHAYEEHLKRIGKFEQALADDGAVIVKFWMHLSRDAQERRLRNLEEDPLTAARVTARDWENWRNYDRFIEVAELTLSRTNSGTAPWVTMEGADRYYRELAVGQAVLEALERALLPVPKATKKVPKSKRGKTKGAPAVGEDLTVLSALDMSKKLAAREYWESLPTLQAELHQLHLQAKERGIASLLVFEGPDGAGKGGAIRRLCAGLTARNYQVHGVAKPTDEELAQHYLWRFWRHLPADGYIGIFDRSWYGRVLVERIEGFASAAEWRRAYAEINDFEQQISEHGTVVAKYWIHISKDEQLKRFKLRQKTPHKRWKLTEEDWRNREKWVQYESAVHDMVQYTSTPHARWSLIEGNDKRYARIAVLRHFIARLQDALAKS